MNIWGLQHKTSLELYRQFDEQLATSAECELNYHMKNELLVQFGEVKDPMFAEVRQ